MFNLGRVANPRPVSTIKTGRVRMRLLLVARRDRSWLWRPVYDLQRAPDIVFRIGQETLPWQTILGAKSAEIGDTPSFLGLAFHNGWQDGKADGRVNSAEVLTTSYKNLVNFSPLTPDFTDAGLKSAARGSLKTQVAKSSQKSPSGHHRTNLSGYIFATKARIDNRKKNLLSNNMSATCPHNTVNFGPLAVEIGLPVWGTSANFNGFRVLAALLHGSQVVGVSQTLRRWTEGATYVRQGDHHVGHWPTFLVYSV